MLQALVEGGPAHGYAAELVHLLQEKRGYSKEKAALIVQLLPPLSREAMSTADTYQRLIDDLNHENLAVRDLAYWHLANRVREGAKKDVKIYRLKPNSKDRDVIAVNLSQIKSGQQKDPILEPYDIVEVDKAKESIGSQLLKFALGAGKGAVTSFTSAGAYRVLY